MMTTPNIPEQSRDGLLADHRPFPELLTDDEQKDLVTRAERLWADLQANNLGGYSGVNRPFYIVHEFRRVIEELGHRDTGLHWSKNQIDAAIAATRITELADEAATRLLSLDRLREQDEKHRPRRPRNQGR